MAGWSQRWIHLCLRPRLEVRGLETRKPTRHSGCGWVSMRQDSRNQFRSRHTRAGAWRQQQRHTCESVWTETISFESLCAVANHCTASSIELAGGGVKQEPCQTGLTSRRHYRAFFPITSPLGRTYFCFDQKICEFGSTVRATKERLFLQRFTPFQQAKKPCHAGLTARIQLPVELEQKIRHHFAGSSPFTHRFGLRTLGKRFRATERRNIQTVTNN